MKDQGGPHRRAKSLAHAPGTKPRLKHQPESLIGDDKRVVGGRARMQQAIADRNAGPLGLIGPEQMIPDQQHAAVVFVEVFGIARMVHAMG